MEGRRNHGERRVKDFQKKPMNAIRPIQRSCREVTGRSLQVMS
jgi:hypothetical protein